MCTTAKKTRNEILIASFCLRSSHPVQELSPITCVDPNPAKGSYDLRQFHLTLLHDIDRLLLDQH